MPKIIREDFSVEDFKQIAENFLYSDARISLPMEKLNAMKERLFKAAPSFQKTFHSYFEYDDNTRYDALCRREESFIKKLEKYNADLQGEEKKVFNLFWNDIAEMVKSDCTELQVQYLTNSCNYFIWKVSQLA